MGAEFEILGVLFFLSNYRLKGDKKTPHFTNNAHFIFNDYICLQCSTKTKLIQSSTRVLLSKCIFIQYPMHLSFIHSGVYIELVCSPGVYM